MIRRATKAQRSFALSRRHAVNSSVRTMANALNLWLLRIAKREARKATSRLRSVGARAVIRKANDWDGDVLELLALMERYGIRQFVDAGKTAATGAGGRWALKPKVKDEFLAQLAHKVQLIVGETRDQVNDSLRSLLRESLDEEPRPSTEEIARRIARQWHGPAEGRESLFSFERAELIARTELAQAENAGIAEGFAQSGVERVAWLASTDGKSGDRHHERMNGKTITVEAMRGDDESKWFLTPLGNRMPWPAWSGAPVGEIARCRCTLVPA